MIILFYAICDLFQLMFLHSFVDKMLARKYNKYISYAIWGITFVLDEVVVFFYDNNSLHMAVYFMIMISIVFGLYDDSIKSKILVLVFMFAFSLFSEIIVFVIINVLFKVTDDIYMLGSALAKILECLLIRIVLLLKKDKNNMEMSFRLWAGVVIIPVATCIIFILQYYLNRGVHNDVSEIAFYSLLLLINYMAFSMFDDIQQVMLLKNENKLLEQQREYYLKQCEQVQKLWEDMREFRHNISNQYISEQTLIKNKKYEELSKKYESMINYIKSETLYASSGNLCIDSLINYKLSLIKESGAMIECELFIPKSLEFNNDDMILLLGNLLDNSVDALKSVSKKIKSFIIKMVYDEPNLMILVSNTYEGERKLDDEKNYITTKVNSNMHGIGLKSIKRIVDSYKGRIFFNVKDDIFEVKIHMIIK